MHTERRTELPMAFLVGPFIYILYKYMVTAFLCSTTERNHKVLYCQFMMKSMLERTSFQPTQIIEIWDLRTKFELFQFSTAVRFVMCHLAKIFRIVYSSGEKEPCEAFHESIIINNNNNNNNNNKPLIHSFPAPANKCIH